MEMLAGTDPVEVARPACRASRETVLPDGCSALKVGAGEGGDTGLRNAKSRRRQGRGRAPGSAEVSVAGKKREGPGRLVEPVSLPGLNLGGERHKAWGAGSARC